MPPFVFYETLFTFYYSLLFIIPYKRKLDCSFFKEVISYLNCYNNGTKNNNLLSVVFSFFYLKILVVYSIILQGFYHFYIYFMVLTSFVLLIFSYNMSLLVNVYFIMVIKSIKRITPIRIIPANSLMISFSTRKIQFTMKIGITI